jgi:hydroxyethylthiazole kinase
MSSQRGDGMHGQKAYRILEKVRHKAPLVHIIMNMVAAQNAANAVLQIGGSPMMADAEVEIVEIVQKADALVLNLGMLNPQKMLAMKAAGKKANEMGIPIILDPVGVGASSFRKESAQYLLENISISIIRGNAAEIAWAAGISKEMRGVDDDGNSPDGVDLAYVCAKKWGVTVAVTGQMDAVSDGEYIWTVNNGHPFMAKITGFGCMATATVAAFTAAADSYSEAAVAALACVGVAGELAGHKSEGPGSFLYSFLDRLYHLNLHQLEHYSKIDKLMPGRNKDV